MKNTTGLLSFAFVMLSLSFTSEPNDNSGLPFYANYRLSLKRVSELHLPKYEYSEYSAAEDIVHVKRYHHITREKAQKLIEDRKFSVNSMLADQPLLYRGTVSPIRGCADSLIPKPVEDTAAVKMSYNLMATHSLIYGNCNIGDNYYDCAYCIFFCPETNELFEVKFFTPMKRPSFDYNELIASIHSK